MLGVSAALLHDPACQVCQQLWLIIYTLLYVLRVQDRDDSGVMLAKNKAAGCDRRIIS